MNHQLNMEPLYLWYEFEHVRLKQWTYKTFTVYAKMKYELVIYILTLSWRSQTYGRWERHTEGWKRTSSRPRCMKCIIVDLYFYKMDLNSVHWPHSHIESSYCAKSGSFVHFPNCQSWSFITINFNPMDEHFDCQVKLGPCKYKRKRISCV